MIISDFCPSLAQTGRPADRVHPRYNILIRTGRTSSRYPNIQNVPKAEGIRYQYQASAGHVLETVSLTDFQASNLIKQRFITMQKANPLEMMGNSQHPIQKISKINFVNSTDEQGNKWCNGGLKTCRVRVCSLMAVGMKQADEVVPNPSSQGQSQSDVLGVFAFQGIRFFPVNKRTQETSQ